MTRLTFNIRCWFDILFSTQSQNSGTHASLFERYLNQIVYAEVNFKDFFPPPYKRKIWGYNNADVYRMNENISQIDLDSRHLRMKDTNEKVRYLNDCLINVFNNYCHNKIISCQDEDAHG